MNTTRTFPWPVNAEHLRLRSAAVEYVNAGWQIVPVDPAGDRLVAGLSPDPVTAWEWWSDQPYGIGCRVGERFDVLEVPAGVGKAVLDRLCQQVSVPPPVLGVPAREQWLFVVTPGARRIVELATFQQVRLMSDGVLLLPPTPILGESVCWISRQDDLDRVPHSLATQWTVRDVLRGRTTRLCRGGRRRKHRQAGLPTLASDKAG